MLSFVKIVVSHNGINLIIKGDVALHNDIRHQLHPHPCRLPGAYRWPVCRRLRA